jgi:hypothetical protein
VRDGRGTGEGWAIGSGEGQERKRDGRGMGKNWLGAGEGQARDGRGTGE